LRCLTTSDEWRTKTGGWVVPVSLCLPVLTRTNRKSSHWPIRPLQYPSLCSCYHTQPLPDAG
jgi:hypothetical protein